MIIGNEATVTSPAAATTAAYANLWGAGSRRSKVREIEIFNTSASTVAGQTQLIRTSARGTQTSTLTPTAAANAQDTNDAAATAVIDFAWSVQPTLAAQAMRLVDIAGTIGSGVIWTWPSDGEVVVANGAGLAIQNASGSTGPIMRIVYIWSE